MIPQSFVNFDNILTLQAEKLQHDLETVTFKLKTVEQQLNQAEELKNELQDKKEKVAALRNQLEAEKLQRWASTSHGMNRVLIMLIQETYYTYIKIVILHV